VAWGHLKVLAEPEADVLEQLVAGHVGAGGVGGHQLLARALGYDDHHVPVLAQPVLHVAVQPARPLQPEPPRAQSGSREGTTRAHTGHVTKQGHELRNDRLWGLTYTVG
jgi:hypothetical protein